MSPAPSRQTKRGARTRERILESAIKVFARRGLHGTRVADIAEEAGIAYGLVYHHFHNKEEILAAIFQERWSLYVAYLTELAQSELPFTERLTRLVHFWVDSYRTIPDLMTVMINEISRSYEFIESHDIETVLVTFQAIAGMVEQAQERREVRADIDSQLVSWMVLGIAEMVLTGYVTHQLVRPDRDAFGRDETQIVALLLRGLQA